MLKLFLKLALVTYLWAVLNATRYIQERAIVTYYHPQYMRDAKAYTARPRRGEPYKTNVSFTLLRPWGNNVTIQIMYNLVSSPTPIIVTQQACNFLKIKWMANYIGAYTNINPNICPVSGFCSFTNIEFPPKSFPFPIPKGKNYLNVSAHLTKTKEILSNFTMKVTVV